MTHIVHPYSHRLGIIRDWRSRWFGQREKYREFLRADILLRELLTKKLRGFYVAGVEMERSQNLYRIIIKSSRPGMIIGRNGEGALKLKKEIIKTLKKNNISLPAEIKIDIEEIRNPEAQAPILAQMAVETLEKRMPFRRAMKQVIEKAMMAKGVEGVKITLSGRLGGAEMSRKETLKQGRVPLSTLRADIDFCRERAYLPYGVIGVKVWVYRGEIFQDQ